MGTLIRSLFGVLKWGLFCFFLVPILVLVIAVLMIVVVLG